MRSTELEISYQEWMQDTSLSTFQRRSARLQALDEAIRRYEREPGDANAFAIRTAFVMWKDERTRGGSSWPSGRDRNGAVSALELQLGTGDVDFDAYRAKNLTDDEQRADAYVMTERGNLARIFRNSSVVFMGGDEVAGKHARSLGDRILHPMASVTEPLKARASSEWEQVKDRVKHRLHLTDAQCETMGKVEEWGGMFAHAADAAFGKEVWSQIEGNTRLGQEISKDITDLKNAIPPWLTQIWGAHALAQEWGQVVRRGYHQYDIGHRTYAIDFGAPEAAFAGMRSCLKEELEVAGANATISSVSFALSTVSNHLDAGAFVGPCISLATAVAKLLIKITRLGFQYRAAQALCERLKNVAALDLTVFKDFPLLGAYFLHCAELSTILPLSYRYTPGWMGTVQRLRKEADYAFVEAQSLINESPFKIMGVPKIKVTDPNGKPTGIVRSTLQSSASALAGPVEGLVGTAVSTAAG